jgi:hypothetical protein
MFCAVCVDPIVGEPHIDGPYRLCKRCATEPVVPVGSTHRRVMTKVPETYFGELKERVRARRRRTGT